MQRAIAHDRAADRGLARRRLRWRGVLAVAALTLLSLVFLAPFAWLLVTALKDQSELSAFPILWWPRHPEWDNFARAVTLLPFGRYALDSLALSAIYTVLVTLTSALVGFAFARLRGRGKRPLFIVMLATIMLPPVLTVIPTYVLYARLGLVGTYWPWVFSGLASAPFLAFLFRQFFAGMPIELEDAAIVDGCGYGRIFWQIFLPLSAPVIATVAILSFQGTWGDYLTPSLLLNQDNTTLAVGLATGFTDPHGFTTVNALAAGAILYVLPVIVLFFVAQRYFVQGIVTTGLKG